MPNQKIYKIGTRGSLLALTQCNQVKDQLEKLTGDKFELEVIKTQGDLITNAPLWQLDGKDFFTKELDEALLSGKIDMVVHSYKDLGSDRPAPIALAAVTKRTYAHDILLIKKSTIEKLKNKNELIVGTSSPRRIVNIEKNLHKVIPYGDKINVKTKMLRGNVNTRIQKLRDDEFDAITLALPGIERLALTESSRLELTKLLDGLNFLILPQSIFPSSASQGALGIECLKERSDNGELFNKLKLMEDTVTKEEVSRERLAFNQYGGGCHLAVGINVKKIDHYFLHTHRGYLNEKDIHHHTLEGRTLPKAKSKNCFIGLPSRDDKLISKTIINANLNQNAHYFVSSKYSVNSLNPETSYESIWSAGNKTMSELIKKGIWVNGSADGLGLNEVIHLKNSKAISLIINQNYPLYNLTNENAEGKIKTYDRIVNEVDHDFDNTIKLKDIFFWTSYPQYEIYVERYPTIKDKMHCCGLGKTFEQFKTNNINVIPFISMEEFYSWIDNAEK